jgi:DNA helicase-2/ATP-dependent DNA helicase PcrA
VYEQVKQHSHSASFLMNDGVLEIDKRAARGWAVLSNALRELSYDGGTVGDKIRIINKLAYTAYAKKEFMNAEERVEDIEQLGRFTDRATDLKSFLAETALQEQFKGKGVVAPDAVVLSTIHQSKGLEWELVFIINLIANAFPSERAAMEEGGMEEERRLFYVAVTRARKNLCLSYTVLGGKNNEFVVSPSPFLEEIDDALLNLGAGTAAATAEYVYEEDENAQKNWRGKSFLRSVEEL